MLQLLSTQWHIFVNVGFLHYDKILRTNMFDKPWQKKLLVIIDLQQVFTGMTQK